MPQPPPLMKILSAMCITNFIGFDFYQQPDPNEPDAGAMKGARKLKVSGNGFMTSTQ